jgi:hypothetical protein
MPAGFPMSQEKLAHLPQTGHFSSEFNLYAYQETRTYLIPQGYDVRVAHSVCGLSDLLHLDQALPLMIKLMVDLFVQLSNFQFGLQIDATVVFAPQAVLGFLPALAHHDDWCLQGGDTGQYQVRGRDRRAAAAGPERSCRSRPPRTPTNTRMSGQLPPKRATLLAIWSPKVRRSSSGRLPLARQNGASLQTVKHGFVQGPQLAMRVLACVRCIACEFAPDRSGRRWGHRTGPVAPP